MSVKTTNKEVQIRPIKIPVIIGDNPDAFFELNPTLKSATLYTNELVFPNLDEGNNVRSAFYAVLLSWFDSPLLAEPILRERKKKAAELARLTDPADESLQDAHQFELNLIPGSQTFTYFKNFLTYQNDFHHKHFLYLEIIMDDVFQFVHNSFLSPIKTDTEGIKGVVNPELPKFIEQLKKLGDDAPSIRKSNFAMTLTKQQIYDEVVAKELNNPMPQANENISRKKPSTNNNSKELDTYKKRPKSKEKPVIQIADKPILQENNEIMTPVIPHIVINEAVL